MNRTSYSSKLLLFGEYTIILGAKALAMPLAKFGGHWAFSKQKQEMPLAQQSLFQLLQYLQQHQVDGQAGFELSLEVFQQELNRGLYFDANIPIGYGLGSSGALTAAVFDRFYCGNKISDLELLKQKLAQIESFFHGASSGIDPLICYLNEAILMESKSQLNQVRVPDWSQEKEVLFLLNTQQARQTGPLVKIFQEKCEEEYYRLRCETELAPMNDEAIHAFLQKKWSLLFDCVHEISHFQLRYFDAMIPEKFRPIWLDGLSGAAYKLKLCGAGGGGFILGFAKDWAKAKEALKDYELLKVF